jgi:SAM-dependent methyltransferase
MSPSRGGKPADWFRKTFDELYPSLYGHRDVREARALLGQVGSLLPLETGRVLDLGCGPGRYLRALGDMGADPVGVDLSRPLLLLARRLLPQVPLVRADMRLLPFRAGSFTSAILMFTTFGYFDREEEDRGVLSGIATLLKPEGGFLMDTINARHVRDHLVASSQRRADQVTVEEKRWIDADGMFLHKESRVTPLVGGEIRIYRERLRLYEPAQIEEMVGASGFRITARLGDYRARPFDAGSSPRLLLIARRKGAEE